MRCRVEILNYYLQLHFYDFQSLKFDSSFFIFNVHTTKVIECGMTKERGNSQRIKFSALLFVT